MLALFSSHTWGGSYDPLLLRAQASIYPKIILLDQELAAKTTNNKVLISIVTTERSNRIAEHLKNSINRKYKNTLGNNKLTINIITFEEIKKAPVATAYIAMEAMETPFKKLVSHASDHSRIVFSYNYTDFKYNALISLHVKEKTYIYFNKPAVQLYNIKFMPIFYKIIKVME